MDDCNFWTLIGASHSAAGGDPALQVRLLTAQLKHVPESEIRAFDQTFRRLHARAATADLWMAACVVVQGCSQTEFADFRSWLIAQGQSAYENAIVDAQSLAEVFGAGHGLPRLEEIAYAAENAWVDQTGRPYEEFSSESDPQMDLPLRTPEDADLKKRMPRLWAIFRP